MQKWFAILVVAVALVFATSAAHAQPSLKMMIPANPGGGWDQTGRSLAAAMQSAKLVSSVQFDNKGGAGGTIGLAQFVNSSKGDANAVMIGGMVMVGAIYLENSPVNLSMVTPLARLTGEYEIIVVPASSPHKTMADLVKAFKANPGGISWGGGSAGGVDHITLALIGQAVGVPAAKLNYVAYQGGGEMIAAVAGGKLAAAISGASEFKQYVDTGRLRLLAVSSETRLPGVNAPTLKESGVNVVIGNWRGLVGPPGMSAAGRASMVGMLDKMSKSKTWQDTLKKQGWDDAYLSGDAFGGFLKEENTRIATVLKEVGLVK